MQTLIYIFAGIGFVCVTAIMVITAILWINTSEAHSKRRPWGKW